MTITHSTSKFNIFLNSTLFVLETSFSLPVPQDSYLLKGSSGFISHLKFWTYSKSNFAAMQGYYEWIDPNKNYLNLALYFHPIYHNYYIDLDYF